MKKIVFVAQTLLSSVIIHLVLSWVLVLGVSAGLAMTLGVFSHYKNIQKYYLNEDMRGLAYYVDSFSEFHQDPLRRAESTRSVRDEIAHLPGFSQMYEQVMLYTTSLGESMFCIGYPGELLSRLHLPSSCIDKEIGEIAQADDIPSIWLDHRLIGQYNPGDQVTLLLSGSIGEYQHKFVVAGYLNAENAHYNFQSGASDQSFSKDIVVVNPEPYVCITVTDGIFDNAKYDADKSAAKFLLPVESSYIADWKVLAQKNGLGQISSMDEILANDNAQIRSMSLPIAILCAVLLLLTLLGIIGSQYQLMNHHRHIAFAFSLCGMDWNTWRYAWLFIAGVPLGIASVLGCVLGNLWWTTILLEPSSHWIAISFLLSLAIVTIALIGVTPTISRWSHMQVMQFRRGSE